MAESTLDPLASIDDLALKTGGKADDEKLKLALDLASGRFREQANNPISMMTETVTLDSDGGQGAHTAMPPGARGVGTRHRRTAGH